jgi:hypothetical protein
MVVKTSIENLELRCRAQNAYEAECHFGRGRLLFARDPCDVAWLTPAADSFRNEVRSTCPRLRTESHERTTKQA